MATVTASASIKWADFLVSAVRFNPGNTHIDYLEVRPDNGTSVGAPTVWSRADVVAAIHRGKTFRTVVLAADGTWRKGQPVFIIVLWGVEYLETVENKTAVDNLDKLRPF